MCPVGQPIGLRHLRLRSAVESDHAGEPVPSATSSTVFERPHRSESRSSRWRGTPVQPIVRLSFALAEAPVLRLLRRVLGDTEQQARDVPKDVPAAPGTDVLGAEVYEPMYLCGQLVGA